MKLYLKRAKRTLAANRWRYLSLAAGFVLFVAPLAFLTRVVHAATGSVATATLHTMCYRMPLDWLFSGRVFMLWGSVGAAFVAAVALLSYFAGPVFCGWLCPVGATSEGLSRMVPLPSRWRLKIKDTGLTASMRWGFLAGFAVVSVLVAYRLAPGWVGSVCCRFCPSSVLQNCASRAADIGTATVAGPDYWHSGSLLALGGWLIVGGVFFAGGRGWCIFFCPLGAVSNLAHRFGARRGWLATRFDAARCRDCADCRVDCPMGALATDGGVNHELCINCYECTRACTAGAYTCATLKRKPFAARARAA